MTQIAETQIKINHMMANLSLMFLVIIIFVGGASIANYMYANVFERRREIGTLMALGASSGVVLRIFLLKALLLGLAGGVAVRVGHAAGRGPRPAAGRRARVAHADSGPAGRRHFGRAVAGASFFPAWRAARLDLVPLSRRSEPC